MTHLRAIAVAAISVLVGCSADVLIDEDPPVLPPEVAPSISECARPLLVPEGRVFLGGMRWRGSALEVVGCEPYESATITMRFVVPDYFLDQDEATNACYGQCVDAGACISPLPVPADPEAEPWPSWDDPAMQQVPAKLLDEARAEAFCTWRGGRLPSLAELHRAEHGGALAIVNAALTDLWWACAREGAPQECGEVFDHVSRPWPQFPVRSWEIDQGPFGHFDLAASAIEVTATHLPATAEEQEALCRIPLDAVDPGSLGSSPSGVGFQTAGNLLRPPQEGETVGWVVPGPGDGTGIKGGVRCAYDPL